MSRFLPLLVVALVAGCNATARNAPSHVVLGQDATAPGEVVVVGSVSAGHDINTGIRQATLTYLFQEYDPATKRLLVDGDSFLFQRSTCLFSDGPECDSRNPHYQVVTVTPGHYVLTMVEGAAMNRRPRHFFLASEADWWSEEVQQDASVEGAETFTVEVAPEGITYFGDVVVDLVRIEEAGPSGPTLVSFAPRRDDALALAALREAGVQATELNNRPPAF